jgi:hypothetical protein
MDTLPRDLVIQNILTRDPQLGLACKEFYEHLPKISPNQKSNICFPSPQNKNLIQIKHGNLAFEYEAKIDFGKLNRYKSHRDLYLLSLYMTTSYIN